MKTAAKVAISLPAETLTAVDAYCREQGKSRSAIFAEAVRALLAQQQVDDRDRRYMEAYLRRPERGVEIAAVAAAAAAATAVWEPWA